MLSIGVLGFIVWSSMMASLLNKNFFCLIINIFIIGWYTLKLYNTFYSANLYNYSKLADCNGMLYNKLKNKILLFFNSWDKNILVFKIKYFIILIIYNNYNYFYYNYYKHSIVSETLRENNLNFDLFRKAYLYYKGKEFPQSNVWLTWFIGFVEGDGAILTQKKKLIFVITQKDPKVLHEIKDVLNFGLVKDFNKFSKFLVNNNSDCFLLYLIFNGNLVISSRINQLNKWYIVLLELKKLQVTNNFGLITVPYIIKVSIKPSLIDSWLSGFTDAEGCFSINIYKGRKEKNYCRCRYILDQKNEKELLLFIRDILNHGSVNLRNKTNNVYRLTVSMNNPLRKDFELLIQYFHQFPLKTTKSLNFELWCKIINIIKLNKHNSKEGLELIKKLRTEMNKYIIDNKSIGLSKYS